MRHVVVYSKGDRLVEISHGVIVCLQIGCGGVHVGAFLPDNMFLNFKMRSYMIVLRFL